MIIYNKPPKNSTSYGVAIFSQTPNRRLIRLYDNWYFLSFPHILYKILYTKDSGLIFFGDMSVCFSNNENPKQNDSIFVPALLNCSGDHTCLGDIDDALGDFKFFQDVDSLCKAVVTEFWKRKFNWETAGAFSQYVNRHLLLGDFKRWEKKTKAQPKWIPSPINMIYWGKYKSFLTGCWV